MYNTEHRKEEDGTKKGHQIFGQEKCTLEKILATPMH